MTISPVIDASINNRLKSVSEDPISIFYIDKFFDQPFYQKLQDSFPPVELFEGEWEGYGGKRFLSEKSRSFSKFMNNSEHWASLYRYFQNPSVINEFYQLYLKSNIHRAPSEQLPWKLSTSDVWTKWGLLKQVPRTLSSFRQQTPVRLRFEFSSMEQQCYLPPHTDNTNKLVSLMLYFPDQGVDSSNWGTEFYAVQKDSKPLDGWDAGMKSTEFAEFLKSYELFHRTEFVGNRLYGFFKSADSWHGIRQIEIPPGFARRTVNINLSLL